MKLIHRFRSGEDIMALLVQWFQQHPQDFFLFIEGVHWLVHQWDACLNAHGMYIYWPLFLNLEQSLNRFHLNKPYVSAHVQKGLNGHSTNSSRPFKLLRNGLWAFLLTLE
jgi:hypothetical protein